MRKVFTLLTMLMLTSFLAFSQNRDVSGRVISEKGEAVSFASIKVKGQKNGMTADENGFYKISAKTGDVLQISSQGSIVEVTVGSSNVIPTTSLILSKKAGEEVTVVATGLNVIRQKKELGYSTAQIKGSDITAAKPVNLQNGLTGKISGLNVSTVNNGVFADTRITLRGIRSLTGNNQPLLVVDGVVVPLSFLNSINPNDVENVNIIKSASGAAVYGSQGVNGVFLITTKRGTKRTPTVNMQSSSYFEKVSFLPKFQTQFGSGSSIDAQGRGVYTAFENQQYGPQFDGSIVDLGPTLADGSIQRVPYTALPSEKLKFFNTGLTLQNDISLSAENYFVSFQDANINGVLPGDKTRRDVFKFFSGKEWGKLSSKVNLNYSSQNYNVHDDGNNDWGSAMWLVFNTAMHAPLTQYKDWKNNKFAGVDGYFNEYYPNPYYVIDNYRVKGRSDNMIASLELNYKFNKWISATFRPTTTVSSSSSKSYATAMRLTDFTKAHRDNSLYKDRNARTAEATGLSNRLNYEAFITAKKQFGKVNLDLLLGNSFTQNSSKSLNASASALDIDGIYNLGVRKGDPTAGEANFKSRNLSNFGQVNFGYDGWLFLSGSLRHERTSLLDNPSTRGTNLENKIDFVYPGVTAAILLSESVNAIKNSNKISYLKLRGSMSKVGNVNIGTYALTPTYSQANGFPYGSNSSFTANNTLPAVNLNPEFVLSKELGFELGLLKNKVNFEFSVYQQDNSDQIIGINTSAPTGYTTQLTNAASFVNKGLEIDLKLTPLVKLGENGNFDLKINYSLNDNKVKQIALGLDEISVGGYANISNYAIKGYPAYVFKATDYVRDDQGRVIVSGTTGYPSRNSNLQIFGRTLPKHNLGITPSFSYKNFNVSVTADYRGGHYVYHGIGPDMDFSGISYRSGRNNRERFVFPNSVIADPANPGKYIPNTSVAVLNGGYDFYTSQTYNRGVATNYLTSAASWKIREIALAYDLPKSVINRLKFIQKAQFSISGRNLFMWLPKSNEYTDPEFNFTTGNATGVNSSANTPPTRLLGATLSVTF